jgi:hypothetical protein
MFRKLTLVAIPAAAFALTLFASVDSTFAKGGKGASNGKHMGMGREHRERGEHRGNFRKDFRYNRYFDRFSFGYPTFGCVEAPVYGCEVVTTPVVTAPVVEAPVVEAPVVEAPVVETPVIAAPVYTTSEPVSTYKVGSEWDHRHFRKDFPRRERPLEHGGRMGHGKK